MTPRLETVEEIFHTALDCAPDQLSTFLDQRCGRDEVLRSKVERLLAAHRQAGSFIETPVVTLATSIFEDDESDLLIGETVGHYKIVKRVGGGGMGAVYLAERADQQYEKQVAIKLIKRGMDTDSVLRHFRNERQILASFDHPNIARLLDGGATESGLPYFVMEYAEGLPIDEYCEKHALSIAERLKLFREVCAAVTYAHRHTVIHRDIKPSNIVVTSDGVPKLLDFGIAKILQPDGPGDALTTMTGLRLMTPEYASPEQVRGEPVSAATDVYSLGVVLYQLLTGQKPYRLKTRTPEEISRAIVEQEPPRPSTAIARSDGSSKSQIPNPKLLRGDLDNIVLMALRKEPERRYQSVEQFSEDIRRHLEALPVVARKDTLAYRSAKFARRNPTLTAVATACLLLALAVAWLLRGQFVVPLKIPIPEKSIAVLPFDNLSDNKENSDFAAGIQDDVLTSLAQIHDLKVISRTSVMAYQKPGGRNIREISQALGVANVLEGSVRRAGNRVLVNVQLIDARNDRHIWAERYDRTVADSIGLQGELATQIATALKAKLAPEERARLDTRLTTNSEAYVLYLTALGREGAVNKSKKDVIVAEELYMQATALDPGFALAYARASILNTGISGDDRARKTKARAQAEEALRLSRTLGEAHMALGLSLYWGEKKYDTALKEFEVAAATSPNNAEVHHYVAGIYRRQGRWRESIASFERALSLDPRNRNIAFLAGNNHLFVRDWPAAAAGYNRALEITADYAYPKVGLAYLEVFRHSNPAAGRRILQTIPAGIDPDGGVSLARWDLAMLERDYAAAEKIATDFPLEGFPWAGDAPKAFYQGRTALARGDIESAQRYFTAVKLVIEGRVRADSDVAEQHANLGLLYAYMQRKEDAIREGRRAVELEPESEDAFHGALYAANLALVYALVGEPDQAITLIERLLSTPGPVQLPASSNSLTLADLHLRWEWDSLRSNPRFQKILVSPERKTVY